MEANKAYVLTVDAINRPGLFTGCFIELRTIDGVVLSTFSQSEAPASGGEFVTAGTSYFASEGDPNLGKTLPIRLGGPPQAVFDKVRFAAVPEPAGAAWWAGAAALFWILAKRPRRAGEWLPGRL